MNVYLAENIGVGVILQKHCSSARVIVSCGNVQRRKADLALGAIVDEQCHNDFVALLEGHCQRSEAILRERTLSKRWRDEEEDAES